MWLHELGHSLKGNHETSKGSKANFKRWQLCRRAYISSALLGASQCHCHKLLGQSQEMLRGERAKGLPS